MNALDVSVLEFEDEFKADKILIDKAKKNKKITLRAASEIQEIKGLERVESVIVKNRFLDKIDEYKCQGVFVEIGVKPNSDFVKNLVEINKNGETFSSTCIVYNAHNITANPSSINAFCNRRNLVASTNNQGFLVDGRTVAEGLVL